MKSESNKAKPILIMILVVVVMVATAVASIWAVQNWGRDSGDKSGVPDNSLPPIGDDEDEFAVLMRVDSREMLEMLDAGFSWFIYVGRDTCPFCQEFAPILIDLVKERGLTSVIYFDTDATRGEPERAEVLDRLGVTAVPAFLYTKNGKVAKVLQDTTSREALLEFVVSAQNR